jgi:hypothetical protein
MKNGVLLEAAFFHPTPYTHPDTHPIPLVFTAIERHLNFEGDQQLAFVDPTWRAASE